MTASQWDIFSLLADKEPLTVDQFDTLRKALCQNEGNRVRFLDAFGGSVGQESGSFSRSPVMAMKVAQGYFALQDYGSSLEWLDKVKDPGQVGYLKARCYQELGEYDQAIGQWDQAKSAGADGFEVETSVVACLRLAGRLEEAAQRLKRLSRVGDIRAEYHYQMGCLHEANGLREEALKEYEHAVSLDYNHTRALFQLAYLCELYGLEDRAIEYYSRCVRRDLAPVNALLNLSVVYEDREDYESAVDCVKRVLAAFPNHPRARMYLKDVQASMIMYYDEDQERRMDRRNKVLEIPISDFELSVRSRNCLRKMNIRTLGDLLRVTEPELLAYKNFGETSLQEIKVILNSKGLRLGQMLEDHKNERKEDRDDSEEDSQEDETLSLSVSQLEMSVRSRKCLERLNINTVGELTRCTEAELLGCKNFGLTSLTEIKKSLDVHSLSLRKLDD